MTAPSLRGAPWVLITEGGHGQSRAAVVATRAARQQGFNVTVTVSDPLSLAGSSRHCSRRVPVPLADTDPEGYAAAVRRELASRDYITCLPASDAALAALGGAAAALADKAFAYDRATRTGLPVPPTTTVGSRAEARAAAEDWAFPVVLKPPVKRAAAVRVARAADLGSLDTRMFPALVQPYISGALHGVIGLMHQGRLHSATHLRYVRTWPAPCGTVASAVTTAPDSELERHLEALLEDYSGLFHVDLVSGHLLDVNPRIHACLALSAGAGVDLVAAHCLTAAGRHVPPRRGRPGVRFRWLEGDLKSLLWSMRNDDQSPLSAIRSLRPRRGTVHSFASAADPMPAMTRLGYAIRRWST